MISRSHLANVTAIDSPLFGGSFVDPEAREMFSAGAYVRSCVKVEVALARVQARMGLIPVGAAEGIAMAAERHELDMERLARETELVGYPVLPIVEQLAAAAGDAGRYLHWGVTTQDIMDTATILQVREGIALIERKLDAVRGALLGLSSAHRDTPMVGRTHLQHALPTTFGYKAAVWLSALDRHCERLLQLRPRVLVGQLSGASGTLASLGDRGLEVQERLCRELNLGVPAITWHSARDNVAETVLTLSLLMGSLAKIALDVSIMMMTEIGEVAEPFVRHRGASSTMPQKHNPISCELIIAASKVARQHAGLMLDAMLHDFERATGAWHLEWFALPESFALTSGALKHADFMLSGLQIFPNRMRKNLHCTGGLIVAEAVMMALAPHTGRQLAHEIIYALCRRALEEGRTLRDVLAGSEAVCEHLNAAQLDGLLEPANYLGAAPMMVDRVLECR